MSPEALTALLIFLPHVTGTPYIPGGNTGAGTDCSGLASWVSNIAVGRDPYSGRFTTANQRQALRNRGFVEGTAPNALVVGWNSAHTAVTLPNGTAVSSGESGGVKFGGGGAYQPQFTQHMYLPLESAPAPEAPSAPVPLEEPPAPIPPEEPPAPESPPDPAAVAEVPPAG